MLRAETEKADAAALKVEQFIAGLERQIGWATRASSAALEQRRADDEMILENTPAIAEITQLDASGRPVIQMTRDGTPASEAGNAEAFRLATVDRAQFGPVRFAKTGPRMRLFIAHPGNQSGVTIADIELRFLSDIVNGIQAGSGVYAYIVTEDGRLITHANASLVARNADLSHLPQVAALRKSPAETVDIGTGLDGEQVLSASAPIPGLNWVLFVEQRLSQAYAPIYSLLLRLLWLYGLSIALCIGTSMLLARRMTVPIKALEAGGLAPGSGRLQSSDRRPYRRRDRSPGA